MQTLDPQRAEQKPASSSAVMMHHTQPVTGMKRKGASGDTHHTKRVKLDATSHKKINPNQNNGRQGTINQSGIESTLPEAQREAKAAATTTSSTTSSKPAPQPSNRRENIRKLAPPRPFPTVPTSVSASGPKSAHKEGKNLICITRHTPLAAYISRCKKLLVDEGCALHAQCLRFYLYAGLCSDIT
jgi:hypothetical protein